MVAPRLPHWEQNPTVLGGAVQTQWETAPPPPPWRTYNIIDEGRGEMEPHKGEVMCPRSHSKSVAELLIEPRCIQSQSNALSTASEYQMYWRIKMSWDLYLVQLVYLNKVNSASCLALKRFICYKRNHFQNVFSNMKALCIFAASHPNSPLTCTYTAPLKPTGWHQCSCEKNVDLLLYAFVFRVFCVPKHLTIFLSFTFASPLTRILVSHPVTAS